MLKRLLVVAASVAIVGALAVPLHAQTGEKKQPSAQQQKMKDCAAKWKEEKAQKHVSGRDAHRKFMGECLKG